MKYFIFMCLSVVILVSTGCSSKKVEPVKNEIVLVSQENISSDEYTDEEIEENAFLEEFEEEMFLEKKSDPFSGYNRVMTDFNDGMYEYILAPTARGYKYVVHKEIRSSVDNFFHNLLFPIRFVNNLLQGKIKNSADEAGRFLINSTIGVLGLFDPAKSYFKLKPHNEDFGQTLGFYGVGTGPHIVLPFFGPSNLRDILSRYPDYLLTPIDYNEERSYNLTNKYTESLAIKAYERVNYVSLHDSAYTKMKKDAVDLYPYLRDVYEQFREKQIKE